MIALSHIFATMRNSVGGITYTANRYASIVGRARVKPVNPSTNALELMRTYFNASVFGWKGLDDGERIAWTNYAKDTPWFNALGSPISLTGQAMYIAQRCGRKAATPAIADSFFDTCPCVPGLFTTPLVTAECCTNPVIGVKIVVLNQHPDTACDAIVRISSPQNFSRKYWTGPYRSDNPILLTGIAAGADDEAEFCPECLGRYFYEVRAFNASAEPNMSTIVRGYADACTDPI